MNSPALALVPVPTASAGIGANARLVISIGHRNHAVRENTDGKQEGSKGGRFAARHGLGAPPFPLLPDHGQRACPTRGRG
jgi:hypothetical protein